MHYAICTYGTRGDVQPYIALALGLMHRGNQVTVLAPENFKDFVEGYSVHFYPLHGDAEAILQSEEGQRVLKTGNIVAILKYMQEAGRQIQPIVNQDLLTGCAEADVLISSVLAVIWVRTIAEKLGKKWGLVQLNPPSAPTKEFPFAGLAFINWGPYNRFTYWLLGKLYWQFNKDELNKFRASLDLTAFTLADMKNDATANHLDLYAFSPQLIRQPADWNSNTRITGFLTLPPKIREANKAETLPTGLVEWLQHPDKPVYIGFGSMPLPDVDKITAILQEINQATNLRVLFCKGWSQIPKLQSHPNLFVVDKINHQWLLPQCKAAVIHGGAGTLAAVLKAKIPVIISSVFGDQVWWGDIIRKKKLGLHIPFKQLTVAKLIKAIKLSQSEEIKRNAAETGEAINQEDGLKTALDAIESYFANPL
ncbi:glycosyltransferase [Mucilaginibacter psychrotolerans]|nr:glycosyltransferase [Mucilaginibacter psychrotolerans]